MKPTVFSVAGLAAVALLGAPKAGVAQQEGLRFGLTGLISLYETHRIEPDGEVRMRGPVAGGEGALAWGPMVLRAGYAEGWLDAAPGIAWERNFVEGYASLGVMPVRGLEIAVGPRARSLSVDGASRPAWFGEMRVRYEAPIIPSYLGATIEGYGSVLGETSEREPLSTMHGGALGVAIRPTGGRLMLHFSYGLDEARYDVGPLRRTVDVLSLRFGYGLP
jgi:hypothetical protein